MMKQTPTGRPVWSRLVSRWSKTTFWTGSFVMVANNVQDHGESTAALFFLLNEDGRRYFHTADEAIDNWKEGDAIMAVHPVDAGRAT